ncbi:MAG TPA: diguanylate cyclase [Acidimicrobiales bacterium]|nr:diguanylate cyclase [Acidimicrobiales bacterium]
MGKNRTAAEVLTASADARTAERLEEDAFIDPLTGLLNRRALERDLAREMAVAEHHGRSLSLLALDVDRLKLINDIQGHATGDEALCTLAGAIRTALRGGDTAYRVGGDEFVVLLPEMAPEAVAGFVGRVRASAPTAFSWGAATFPAEATTGPSLLDLADQRLLAYRKSAGDERVPMTADRFTNPSVAPAVPARSRRSRNPAVVAAFLGGLLLGGGSLASAATGTLPGPMQHAAHSVLARIGIPVPSGRAQHGTGTSPAERSVERFLDDAGTPCTIPGGSQFSGTHGQYVAAHPDDPSTPHDERALAAKSRCGRPLAGGPSQPPAAPGKPDDPGNSAEAGGPDGAGRQDAGQPASAVKPAAAPTGPDRSVQSTPQQRPVPGPTTTTTTTTVAPSSSPAPAEPVAEEPAPPGRRVGRDAAQEPPASPAPQEPGGASRGPTRT